MAELVIESSLLGLVYSVFSGSELVIVNHEEGPDLVESPWLASVDFDGLPHPGA